METCQRQIKAHTSVKVSQHGRKSDLFSKRKKQREASKNNMKLFDKKENHTVH